MNQRANLGLEEEENKSTEDFMEQEIVVSPGIDTHAANTHLMTEGEKKKR